MATVTPNFNWPVPTSTDLVKDGATAIEALGDSIDGSLVDLKGGTTGQVLSKTSGTDMDFTWVTTDDANAIQNSIVDAKGDLISATANDTPARLAVGANGETLVADSSTSTGLRYQGTIAAGRNIFINGNFDVWQRGTSTASVANGVFLADRWKTVLTGTGITATYSQDTSVPNGNSKFSAKLQQLGSSATSVSEFGFYQPIEGGSVLPLLGKTVTVSFYYRSSQTGTHYARLYAGGLTGGTDVTNTFTVNVADTWEKKSINFSSFAAATAMSVALTAEGAGLQIGIRTFGSGGTETVAANDYFQISQIQLEAGSVATAFQTATGTLQGELDACMRYYEKSYDQGVNPATSTFTGIYWGAGSAASATTSYLNVPLRFAVTKRTAPSITFYDAVGNANQCTRSTLGVGDNNAQAITAGQIGMTGANAYSTGTSNTTFMFHYVASAEL
jgi:hypothetical protein